MNIRGRCHCSKIQFEFSTPSEFCSHCHCESCRRIHGAPFVTWTSVPDDQLKITAGKDQIKVYQSSPRVKWMSCDHCSSPIFQTTNNSPGRTYIPLSSLIDSLDREPDSHVSYEERVTWVKINDGLPKFREKASDRIKE